MQPSPSPPNTEEIFRLLWPTPTKFTASALPRPLQRNSSYVAFPNLARTSVLIPTGPSRVTAATLAQQASGWTSRTQRTAAVVAGRLGAARLLPGVITIHRSAASSSLLDHLSETLGEQLFAGIRLGPPRANRKPVLQLVNGAGATVGFAKVGINSLTDARLEAETTALEHLRKRRLKDSLEVPRVLAYGRWNGLPYCVTQNISNRINTPLTSFQQGAALRELVASFPSTQRQIHEAPWWARIRTGLTSSNGSDGRALSRAAGRIEDFAGWRTITFGAAHGDWSPWNVIPRASGAAAWDWERFANDAPVGLDALHFAVQRAVGPQGLGPVESLRHVTSQAGSVVSINGALDEDGPLLMALYLLQLGWQFLADGQEEAGSRRGPLSSWLLPVLADVTADLP